MLGYQGTSYITFDANNLPVAGGAPSTANQARAVILTSKTFGHLGGNTLTAQFLDPAANNSPLTVSLTGNAIQREPGDQRHRRDHQHRG